MTKSYDAIIVGTGAGGASAAFQLAKAGMKVLALEKGPRIELSDISEGKEFGYSFYSRGRGDELKYIRDKFLQKNVRREIRSIRYSEHGDKDEGVEKPTTDGWMSQVVGGGTVHYGGASFRADAVDLQMATWFATDARLPDLPEKYQVELRDWPISFSELTNWYSEAERLIGIAGAPASGLPALQMNKAEMFVRDALITSGDRAKLISTPMAINTGKHGGREPCHNSGLCQEFACRFEAKSDMRVTLLREAEKTGNLTISPNSFVRKLITSNGKISGIECILGDPDGECEIEILSAPVYVVACEIVETIRLLKCSGIGNPNVIGKYIMFHVTGGARSLAPSPTTTWDNAPHTGYIRTFYNDFRKGERPFLKTGILLLSTLGGPLQAIGGKSDGRALWGKKALTFLNEVYPYRMDLSYIGEGMPTANNRVEIKSNSLDRYGMPTTSIVYRPHPFDLNAAQYIQEESVRILKLARGLTKDQAPSHLAPFLSKETTAKRMFHGTGGCRFGEDKNSTVLDPNCMVHGIENLYVVDGSFMPTGTGVNPTLTIQANALRVGELISNRMGNAGYSLPIAERHLNLTRPA